MTNTKKLRQSKTWVVETCFCNTIHKLLKAPKVNGRDFHAVEVIYLKAEELWRLWTDITNVKMYPGCNSKGLVPKKACIPGARGHKSRWEFI